MAKSDVRKLYTSTAFPSHWIGADGKGVLWIWPVEAKGWSKRTPFTTNGARPRGRLVEVDPVLARGTGWRSGAGSGRKRLGGDEVGEARRIRAAPQMWARAEVEAKRAKISVTEFVRRSIAEKLDRR